MTKFLIITSRYYQEIAEALELGACKVLDDAAVKYDIVEVPGALEIPAAISMAADEYQGFIAIGCVIRGETSHYDIVAGESARGLNDLAIQKHLAIGNAILTVDKKDQAMKRADPNGPDKGGVAASAALSMADLRNRWVK